MCNERTDPSLANDYSQMKILLSPVMDAVPPFPSQAMLLQLRRMRILEMGLADLDDIVVQSAKVTTARNATCSSMMYSTFVLLVGHELDINRIRILESAMSKIISLHLNRTPSAAKETKYRLLELPTDLCKQIEDPKSGLK